MGYGAWGGGNFGATSILLGGMANGRPMVSAGGGRTPPEPPKKDRT